MLLRTIIVLLALAVGALHLWLNQMLFRGNFWGQLPFPSPFPLPLNQLFTLNFIAYIVLAIGFWFSGHLLGARQWLIDAALIVLTALTIAGWIQIGAPNPMGWGYISKILEVALILAVAWHLRKARSASA